jgi:hypothetical protein
MEAIASSQEKDSGKGRTIVEGLRSQWLWAERGFYCLFESNSNQVIVGGKLYPG